MKTYCDRSIGLLHIYNNIFTSRFNAQCVTDVVAYRLLRDRLDEALNCSPTLAKAVIHGLSLSIRQSQFHLSTPLLEQSTHRTTITATTLAALVDAYYRSAMNNLYNRVVMHKTSGAFFPQMHIQIPIRVVYLNGLKQTRRICDRWDAPAGYAGPWKALMSFMPGIVMCPFSSILEASNVGDVNKTPMMTRWRQGYAPRLGREIIFGLGLNQVADFCTERLADHVTENRHVQGYLGSFTAGLIAGYLSAVPHALSAMKLHHPEKSYFTLWKELYMRALPRVPAYVPAATRPAVAQVLAVLLPVGNLVRSVQIGGTFIIVNGVTYALRNKSWY